MKRVIIESPYAGNVSGNLRYLRRCMRDAMLNHEEAPFASHELYTRALDDAEPDERKLGIEAGLVWALQAEATVVYEDLGISHGMKLGIERAHAVSRPVVFRKLPGFVESDFTDGDDANCCRFHYLGGATTEECRSARH